MKNYRVLVFFLLIILGSCKTQNRSYQVDGIGIDDYSLFNECLIEKGTIVIVKKDSLFFSNKKETCQYTYFYRKGKLGVVNDDMIIYFYLNRKSDKSLTLTSKWLPRDYMIDWKEDYMKYKEEGVKIELIKGGK